jgi:transcription termination factor Rho
MDEVIFEEFKGTGNWKSCSIARFRQTRVFPAIDILKSGTRKEELLVPKGDLAEDVRAARILSSMGTGCHRIPARQAQATKTNSDFFDTMNT